MQLLGQILVLMVVAGLAIGIVSYSRWRRRKRTNEMAALARELNWSFVPDYDVAHESVNWQFSTINRGHSGAAFNTLTGLITIDGQSFKAVMGDFTYRMTARGGKTSRTTVYVCSYLMLKQTIPGAPALRIRQERLADKVHDTFGSEDIDFESSEFSRKFFVTCRDKKYAYAMIHPRMMELLLAASPPEIEIGPQGCCICDGCSTWGPGVFASLLSWIPGFIALWPRQLAEAQFAQDQLN